MSYPLRFLRVPIVGRAEPSMYDGRLDGLMLVFERVLCVGQAGTT